MKKKITSVFVIWALLLALMPVSAVNLKKVNFLLTAEVSANPPEICLQWAPISLLQGDVVGQPNVITIDRKLPKDDEWENMTKLSIDQTTYTDTTVEAGVVYQYRVASYYSNPGATRTEAFISCGIEIPAVEDRGKLILLTDNDTQAALADKLDRLAADLTADGWQVIRRSVERSDDPHAAADVKAVIKEVYDSDPTGVKSLFIFGHVPIPLIGWSNYDSHGGRPFPGDIYYADMDGEWTDETVSRTGTGEFSNRSNVPGDGIFDQDKSTNGAELTYGRVDLYDLPLFAPLTEMQLLERYLDKDHAYRMGELDLPNRALVQDGFNAYASTGYEMMSVLCGGTEGITEEDYMTELRENEYTWQYIDGPGEYGRVGYEEHGAYDYAWREAVETEDFVYNKFKSLFSIMYGSYMGEWNSTNNIMRAYLAMPEYGLTNMLSAQQIHGMALGQTFGEAMHYSASTSLNLPTTGTENIMFFGDPTLSLYPVTPVYHLKATPIEEGNLLQWTPAPAQDGREVVGYYVYRSDSATGEFEKLTQTPVTKPAFIDTAPDSGKGVYMVRSVAKVTSPGGTFYKIGQGSTVSVTQDVEIHGVTFRNGEQPCEAMPDSGVLTAQADISNHTQQPKELTLLLGVYAADGGLKQLSYQSDTVAGEHDTISASLTVSNYQAGDYAKAYIWESLEDNISMDGTFALPPQ